MDQVRFTDTGSAVGVGVRVLQAVCGGVSTVCATICALCAT